ncbi:MAG: hypothetical protein KH230_22275 [Enterocloster asparagiformis]|nr:hypothetical protein [Enterocloster asparagiformis]
MKTRRAILFRVGAVLLLLIIAASMMVIGRGHTVYMDNKAIEYNGQTYPSFYKVDVYVGGERVAKLRDKDRGMATNIGQKFTMTLAITREKGGEEENVEVSLNLPYNMDGIAINLPACMAGLPGDVCMSEFVIATQESEESTEETVDEFGIGAEF